MFTSPPDASTTKYSRNPVHSILSYDSNIMLAAIICLLVVILFVLLLHIYAKWFLFRARQRSRSSVLVPLPQVLGAASSLHHHFHSYAIHTTFTTSPSTKGLESTAISSIPIFVYKTDEHQHYELIECAICLSVFEDEEIGRRLPRCSHAFHVQCIDMWFDSHSTCPICRSCPVLLIDDDNNDVVVDGGVITETTLPEETEFNDCESSRMEIRIENIPNEGTTGTCIADQMCSSPSSSSVSSHLPLSVGDSAKS